jgi:hypothetical protein
MKDINLLNEILNKYGDTKNLYNSFINEVPSPCIELEKFIPTEMVLDMKKEMDISYISNAENVRDFNRANSHMAELWELSHSPIAESLKNQLHSSNFIKWLEEVTGIDGLIPDPHIHGAGYSRSWPEDSLAIHTDFNWNDKLKLHRALTLIIYLNPEWKEEWNGDIQYWDFDRKNMIKRYFPSNGNCVIWKYHKRGYHGHPNPIMAPDGYTRDAFRIFYYVSSSEYKKDDLPHRSLYWYNETTNEPIDYKEEL